MDRNLARELITMHQATNTMVNGQRIKKMVMVFFSIKMELCMMGNGLMINQKIKDKLFMLTKINIKEHF